MSSDAIAGENEKPYARCCGVCGYETLFKRFSVIFFFDNRKIHCEHSARRSKVTLPGVSLVYLFAVSLRSAGINWFLYCEVFSCSSSSGHWEIMNPAPWYPVLMTYAYMYGAILERSEVTC